MLEINKIHNGDCLEVMKSIDDNSIDAIVTDPPYELGFMGNSWDSSGIAYNVDLWKECLRVLKPGAHLVAFSGSRTEHRMTCAIEDAGFEIRDKICWIFSQGFPKSLNVGKKFDKLYGNERDFLGYKKLNLKDKKTYVPKAQNDIFDVNKGLKKLEITRGNSKWEGFGTALKPAHEPICLARKPLAEKTIVENVLKYGCGAIDIDGCRIPIQNEKLPTGSAKRIYKSNQYTEDKVYGDNTTTHELGRFPANIICTDNALDDGTITKSGYMSPELHKRVDTNKNGTMGVCYGKYNNEGRPLAETYGDSGSKSRYFDIDVWAERHGILQFPKACKSERNEGLEVIEEKNKRPQGEAFGEGSAITEHSEYKGNFHPTVKPISVISWLVRLISKEGDIVLDPFAGSGTTGVACVKLNRQFILMEREQKYISIIQKRIGHVLKEKEMEII